MAVQSEAAQAKTALPIVFGNMTIGNAGVEGVRVSSLDEANKMLDVFQAHGHNEIDTARVYGGGSSEKYLASSKWQARNLIMDTKLYPNEGKGMAISKAEYSHRPADVRRGLMDSLAALQTDKIDMFYLHGPDRKTPIEDTLREVNALYTEGYFTRFGVSNYMAWEVATMCAICERQGWVKPVVYQGIYNALHRAIEPELMPCLREHGIALYAFQPLAGGLLTSRYKRDMHADEYEAESRFDPKKWQGQLHQRRYFKSFYFDALDLIRPVIAKHGLTEAECALRWVEHHSLMKEEGGDKIIIGASSAKQLEQNLLDLEKGPLPEEVVEVLEAGWAMVKGVASNYFH